MAESRRMSSLGEVEPRDVRRYLAKTDKMCPTCEKSVMYVKMRHDVSEDLECPVCDQMANVPIGMVEHLPIDGK